MKLVKILAGTAALAAAVLAAGSLVWLHDEAEHKKAKTSAPQDDDESPCGNCESCAECEAECAEECENEKILSQLCYNESKAKLCSVLLLPEELLTRIIQDYGIPQTGEGDMGEPLYPSEDVVRAFRKWQFACCYRSRQEDEGEALPRSGALS